ncbi:MAG: FAD/NAD(P)-binding protein [Bradyrhizobium sp.]
MSIQRHVIIVGGGASGVLLACHLLRSFSDNIKVTLIEKSPAIGRGIAYGTADPAHLLNVRAANMSAFGDDPEHFWRWLEANNLTAAGADQLCFVSRQIYGRYIESLLQGLSFGRNRELNIVQGECLAIAPVASGAIARLRDGSSISAEIAVLATGNETCQTHIGNSLYASPWEVPAEGEISKDGHILIVGTGLTMVDYVQSLLHSGHRGPITAISRHGLLSKPHRPVVAFPIDRVDIPFGHEIAELVRWFRKTTRIAQLRGGDWRSVVDGIRPFTQELWQSLSIPARQRFLRHARTWWDVHRHRMAPEVEHFVGSAMSSSQLTIIAGKVQFVERGDGAARVTFRRRGSLTAEPMEAIRIVECTGINPIPHNTTNPVLRSLFDNGFARIDPLGIGLDVTENCALLDKSGEPSTRIFAIGPLTRAAFWETVAIPDIRTQCHRLADHIHTRLNAA